MKRQIFLSLLLVNIFIIVCASCSNNNRNSTTNQNITSASEDTIVKYMTDTLDVFIPLIPNDSLETSLSFRGIPLALAKDSIPTDHSQFYVTMDMVILDQNPKITSNLLSFAISILSEWGFTHTQDSILSNKFNYTLVRETPIQEILYQFSDFVREEFYAKLPAILSYCSMCYNMDIDIYPVFLNDDYVTYRKYAYYYTDGAHGNDTQFLQTYNIKTGETVRLEDIIKPDKIGDFRKVVENHMVSYYHISPDINRSVENFPLNDPGITEVGLVMSYGKYFLTAGAYGCPRVVISYDEIRDCLKPPFNHYQSIIP